MAALIPPAQHPPLLQSSTQSILSPARRLLAALALFLLAGGLLGLTGCQCCQPADPMVDTVSGRPTIRIIAGTPEGVMEFKDSKGNIWQPDTDKGFSDSHRYGSDTPPIAGTPDQALYWSERYNPPDPEHPDQPAFKFSWAVPNGKYMVRLHFAEIYFNDPGLRVFSVNVEGKVIPNLDIFAAAKGDHKALVKEVIVDVKDGKLDIAFTAVVENPKVSAIEIIPVL